MNDAVWTGVRSVLMIGGAYLAGKGKIGSEDVGPIVDLVITVASASVSLGAALWAIYIRYNTKTVPAEVGTRSDVPTLSPVTGKQE